MASFILARNIPIITQNPSIYPEDVPGVELQGKVAGIIGLGNIGSNVARLVTSIGMKCIYWSPRSRNPKYEYVELETLLKNADFIYLTFYESEKTRNFIDKHKLSLLKPTSYLISGLGSQPHLEGDSVDWEYAIKMVQTGKLAGLALEVGEKERISVEENIFITPGNSGWCTKEAIIKGSRAWIDNIVGIIKGNPPNVILKGEKQK